MYSELLKERIISVNNKISRTGKFTKPYEKFLSFLFENNIKIDDLLEYDLSVIKIAILNDLPSPKCHCGAKTTYRKTVEGIYYPANCSMYCRSSSIRYCKKLSKTKKKLYKNGFWKENVENKKIKTNLMRHGAKHPMQNVNIFLKQQKACFTKNDLGLHGNEPYVYEYLLSLYPDLVLGTDFIKENNKDIIWNDEAGTERRSFPDFFSSSLNAFIEIKGSYTRNIHDVKIMKCKDRLNEMSFGYFIVTVYPKKHIIIEQFNKTHIKE